MIRDSRPFVQLEDVTEEFYTKQSDINMKGKVRQSDGSRFSDLQISGPIFLTQASLPHLARGGRIVIISSVSARMGVPQQTVYAATKASNEAMARVWAKELGQKYGVTVNCVNPGPVATEMW